MSLRVIPVFLAILGKTMLYGQPAEWSQKPSVGVYFTSLKMERYSGLSGVSSDETLRENTANIMGSIPLNAKLRLGFQYFLVNTILESGTKDRSQLFGLAAQYNLRARKRLGAYVETGYAFGNYCPCGNAAPYLSDTLNHFWSLGLGLDYRLISWLHLKAGFVNYNPLVRHNDIYNWTQPFLGLNVYFAKGYKPPFKSRFIARDEPVPKEQRRFLWEDERLRRWNAGLSTSGFIATQYRRLPDQQEDEPLLRYREISISPRVNYWFNQAVMAGAQLSLYRYANNQSNARPKANGFGVGIQARVYPLNITKADEFRAIRIGKRANWHISPIAGIEFRGANYSWIEPEEAGKSWQYADFQPYIGFALSYKRLLNIFSGYGPTIAYSGVKATSPRNGVRLAGLEYHFVK